MIAVKGVTIIITDDKPSSLNLSNIIGKQAKHKDFQKPVGKTANTSGPSTKLVITVFCSSFRTYPSRLACFC